MKPKTEKYTFDNLLDIVAKLRSPDGCPWDREQTHKSIRTSMVEEAYELVEAIDGGNPEKIADESGDVLLQVVLHAQIGKDEGEYDIDDVTDAICRKLIHRHPHVFGSDIAESTDEVLKNWDAIKRADRRQSSVTEELCAVSSYIPTLIRAQKIYRKARKVGYKPETTAFDFNSETELGRLIFAVLADAEQNGLDCEVALCGYINKFISDFKEFEQNKEIKDET